MLLGSVGLGQELEQSVSSDQIWCCKYLAGWMLLSSSTLPRHQAHTWIGISHGELASTTASDKTGSSPDNSNTLLQSWTSDCLLHCLHRIKWEYTWFISTFLGHSISFCIDICTYVHTLYTTSAALYTIAVKVPSTTALPSQFVASLMIICMMAKVRFIWLPLVRACNLYFIQLTFEPVL